MTTAAHKPGDTVSYNWSVGSPALGTARTEVRRGMVADVVKRGGEVYYRILGARAPVKADRIVTEQNVMTQHGTTVLGALTEEERTIIAERDGYRDKFRAAETPEDRAFWLAKIEEAAARSATGGSSPTCSPRTRWRPR